VVAIIINLQRLEWYVVDNRNFLYANNIWWYRHFPTIWVQCTVLKPNSKYSVKVYYQDMSNFDIALLTWTLMSCVSQLHSYSYYIKKVVIVNAAMVISKRILANRKVLKCITLADFMTHWTTCRGAHYFWGVFLEIPETPPYT